MERAGVPAQGARGPCKGCGAIMVVHPNGIVEGGILEPGSAGPGAGRPKTTSSPDKGRPPARIANAPTFLCPVCGHPHNADLSKVPPGGAKGRCGGCGALLLIKPDGSVQPAEGKQARWYIQQGEEALGPFTGEQMAEFASVGGLTPEKAVKAGNSAWAPAASVAILAPLFKSKELSQAAVEEETLGDEDHCYAHADNFPVRRCTRCERFLCEECINPPETGGPTRPLLLCPVCGGSTRVLRKKERWTPFYRDMVQVLLSPLRGRALFYFFFLVFLELSKIPCRYGGGIIAVIILLSVQWTFYIHVIHEVANGSYELPGWPDVTNMWVMVGTFAKVLVVTLVSLAPAIALAFLGEIGFSIMAGLTGAGQQGFSAASGPILVVIFLVGVAYTAYLPICIAIVALFNTIVPALNPIVIFRIIGRIGKPYTMAVALWIAFLVIQISAKIWLATAGIGGEFVLAPLTVYITLVSVYVIGRVCYENEDKINWS